MCDAVVIQTVGSLVFPLDGPVELCDCEVDGKQMAWHNKRIQWLDRRGIAEAIFGKEG